MGEVIKPPAEIWRPEQTRTVGPEQKKKASIVVYSRSGGGKTHLAYQLLRDPDFGPDEVLILMREDGTSTYGEGANIIPVENLFDAKQRVSELAAAIKDGKRLPRVLFLDSLSGLIDGYQAYRRDEPLEEWSEKRQAIIQNKQAEFGELGRLTMELMIALRDDLPGVDVITAMTTWSPGPGIPPELAVEGKMVPKHLTRLTNHALYLVPEAKLYPRSVIESELKAGSLYQPHRIVDEIRSGDDSDVMVISRFFYTQDTGEVLAKGHRNLRLKEKANLPDVLRKIHADAPIVGAQSKGEGK